MKSYLLNLGEELTQSELKKIKGGKVQPIRCHDEDFDCQTGRCDYLGHCF